MSRSRVEPNYTIATPLRVVVWHGFGVTMTIHEWINWQAALGQYPDEIMGYNHFVDFREGTWAIENEEIFGAMGFSERFFENDPEDSIEKKLKSAVVCSSDKALAGWRNYVELTNVSANPFQIAIFESLSEAISWLGHTDADFQAHAPKLEFD